jgi:hypothetical protein
VHKWTAQVSVHGSTIYIGFQTPPVHSAFNGGGGPECVIKDAHRSAVKNPTHRSTTQGVFWTPSTDLPLAEGGGGLERNLSSSGPLFIFGINLPVPSPIASYCLTYLRHLLTSPSTFLKESHPLILCQSFPPIHSW